MIIRIALCLLIGIVAAQAQQVRLSVQNNALLAATPVAGGSFAVIRQSVATLGDSPPATFTGSSSPCPLNGGNGDGATQVKAPDGCWLLAPRLPNGTTILYLPIGYTNPTTPGIVITPDGSLVPGLATTVTMGFNEVEAYDFQKGWATWVVATGEYSGEGSNPEKSYLLTNDAGGFVVQPLANRFLKFSNGIGLCQGNAGAGCVNVDSMMKGKIILEGFEFAQAPTTASSSTCVWSLNAHTAIPNEGIIGIVDSQIDFGNVAVQPPGSGTPQAAVCINLANGPVNNVTFFANELNGENVAKYGLIAFGTMGVNGFGGNTLFINHCHLTTTACIQIGTTTTNQTFYGKNTWTIGSILPKSGDGLNTYGTQEIYQIGNIASSEGGLTNGITLQAGTAGNAMMVGLINGASGASVNNLSSFTTNTVMNGGSFVLPAAVACASGVTAGTVVVVNGLVTHC